MTTLPTIRRETEHAQATLREQYREVRAASLRLCAPLGVEDYSLQAMPDASPAKWHLAHTTWFFETFLLSEHLPNYKPVNPAFRSLFNSYYNAIGEPCGMFCRGQRSRKRSPIELLLTMQWNGFSNGNCRARRWI
jgi:hypothetical protein